MPHELNRQYKDNLFRFIFGHHKEHALSLYNAINNTDYKDPEDITFNTLENVVFLGMKNDVSFVIDAHLTLLEHQSKYSENMPLRGLFYLSDLLRKEALNHGYSSNSIYDSRRIILSTPQVIVLYNGTDKKTEDHFTLELKDSFENPEQSCVNLIVDVYNVRYGHSASLMKKCPALRQYATFVSLVQQYEARGLPKREAALKATDEIIAEGTGVSSLFEQNRSEVVQLFLEEYNEEEVRQIYANEARVNTGFVLP